LVKACKDNLKEYIMAKQLDYTHPNGTNYPASYWRITQLVVDMPALYAKFVFAGWKDEQARLDGKQPIGERVVHINGADFAAYFADVTAKLKNPQEVGYEYCGLFKDVPDVEEVVIQEATEEVPEVKELRPINKSFFKDALDV
jgi:hypothetical protein